MVNANIGFADAFRALARTFVQLILTANWFTPRAQQLPAPTWTQLRSLLTLPTCLMGYSLL